MDINIVLDTNVLKEDILAHLHNRGGYKLFLPLGNFIESSSSVANPHHLKHVRNRAALIAKYNIKLIEGPEDHLKNILGQPLLTNYFQGWDELFKDIRLSTWPTNDLKRKVKSTWKSLRWYKNAFSKEINNVFSQILVVLTSNPEYIPEECRRDMERFIEKKYVLINDSFKLSGNTRQWIKDYLKCDLFLLVFQEVLLDLLAEKLNMQKSFQLRGLCNTYIHLYRGIFLLFFDSSYSRPPEKNDIIDIELAYYLEDDNWIALTEERKLINYLAKDEPWIADKFPTWRNL